MDLENNLRFSLLFELYKTLLTHKQQKLVKDFLDNNLSISELAQIYDSTRQAVNDLLKRTFRILERYEEKLGLLKKFEAAKEKINLIVEKLDNSNYDTKKLKSDLNNILEVL